MTNCIHCSFDHFLAKAFSERVTGQNSPKKNWRHIRNLGFLSQHYVLLGFKKVSLKPGLKTKLPFTFWMPCLSTEYMAS